MCSILWDTGSLWKSPNMFMLKCSANKAGCTVCDPLKFERDWIVAKIWNNKLIWLLSIGSSVNNRIARLSFLRTYTHQRVAGFTQHHTKMKTRQCNKVGVGHLIFPVTHDATITWHRSGRFLRFLFLFFVWPFMYRQIYNFNVCWWMLSKLHKLWVSNCFLCPISQDGYIRALMFFCSPWTTVMV